MEPNVTTSELYDVRITGFAVFDNQNHMIRKVGFANNDYFNRTAVMPSVNTGHFSDSYDAKSLKLDSVKFYDSSGAYVNNYNFQYDNTPLPPRGSTALDYWGYYNGQSNANLIPQIWYNNYWTASPQSLGGNRSTNFNYMKAASLTQVTYPTGGYTQFGYEPNYYLITTPAGQSTTQAPQSISLQALQSTGRTAGCSPPVELRKLPADTTMTFTVSNAVVNNVATVTATFSDFEVVNNSEMTATVTDVTNGAVYSFVQGTQTMTQQVTTTQTINFYQGHTYTLAVNTNAVTGSVYGYCNCPFIQLNIAYTTLDTQTVAATMIPSQAGGLRIKTITNYNIDNSVISQKTFTYGDSAYGPNQVGVGTLITDTSSNLYNFPLLIPDANEPTCQQSLYPFTWYTSNSLIDLGLNNGCAVVYSKVTEQDVSASDTSVSNGKTEYYYNTPYSYRNPLPGSKYPYYSWIYPDWGRNQLIKKIEYKLNNGLYTPVHEIDYTYQTQPENRIKTLVINEMQPEQYSSSCFGTSQPTPLYLINSPQRFFFYNFYESCGLILKTGETETFYSSNGSLTSTRTYSYNNYLDPSTVQSTDSRQNQIVTTYKYTGDLNYSTLSTGHMVSLPTFQETTINGQVRSGSILTYDSLGDIYSHYAFNQSSPTTPIPYINYASIPSTYEQKENLSYDPIYNNLQEIDKNYSSNTAYLWGYTGQYPIAQIENATSANTAYTSFESDGVGNWTIPDTTRIRTAALTGNMAYHLNGSNSITKSGLNTSFTYIIGYWQDTSNSVSVNGASGMAKMTIGTWTYYEDTVHGTASVTISGTGTIDELRLYPKGALMSTYTYAPLIGMTSQCDPSSRLTYYSYDTMGRLKLIKDQYGNILKRYDYEYQTGNH
jgi:hypothetical protein